MNHEDECPRCFYRTDRVSMMTGKAAPRAGDVTICLNCGGIFIFSDRLQMREMTEAEAAPVLADPHVQKFAALIKFFRAPPPPRKTRG